jgi:uncharacterized protein (DUF433 family)
MQSGADEEASRATGDERLVTTWAVPGEPQAEGLVPGGTAYHDEVADALLDRIAVDPNTAFGKPTIRGTRIWVGLILGLLADGMSVEEVLAEYPQLEELDIRACLAFGAQLANGRFVDVA